MSLRSLIVLGEIADAKNRGVSGAEIMRITGMPSGTVYPILERLSETGLVSYEEELGDPRTLGRPLCYFYSLTPEGERCVVTNYQLLSTFIKNAKEFQGN